jgi:hypothetical protein
VTINKRFKTFGFLYSIEGLMGALRPKELLDYLLEAQTLTPQQLDEFIQANPEEDQYFDYKNGRITSRQAREQGKQTIRRYIRH